jgi:hypothetical protein
MCDPDGGVVSLSVYDEASSLPPLAPNAGLRARYHKCKHSNGESANRALFSLTLL